ncbi:MAG: A/G-specific adenine glycosylase [bacterium]|nr:A/G-specific adenine glycosylase [bacterium]
MTIPVFQKMILLWYRENGRHDLPWRKTRDPYHILTSEIMLQQTQVDRVIPKYQSFLEKFPTIEMLASAPIPTLLKEWKGLGYNRRALYLQRAVQKIKNEHNGIFPRDVHAIQSLPGVGHYTARAVAAFSFNTPEVFIETNIRRIFIHFFFRGEEGVTDEDIFPYVRRAVWKKDPHAWYSALMDYGAVAMKDIPNPNKKSAHYVRQSRFEGSPRYARAKLVDYLLAKKSGENIVGMQAFFQTDTYLLPYGNTEKLKDLLQSLQREGFLERVGKRWRIIK